MKYTIALGLARAVKASRTSTTISRSVGVEASGPRVTTTIVELTLINIYKIHNHR